MIRFDALLSRFGYCSRREASGWVKSGRAMHRGQPVRNVSEKVDPHDVLIDGNPVPFPDGIYIALNKPTGCTCSHREEGELVDDLLPPSWLRRNPSVTTVGRLDKDTSGLLLITDDGKFVHDMTSPKKHVPKIYAFTTSAPVPEEAVALFASGEYMLSGETTPCLPADLVLTGECSGTLTLHEGRYHQVRRMLAEAGAPVATLRRTHIGTLSLEELGLEEGEWKEIDPASIRP